MKKLLWLLMTTLILGSIGFPRGINGDVPPPTQLDPSLLVRLKNGDINTGLVNVTVSSHTNQTIDFKVVNVDRSDFAILLSDPAIQDVKNIVCAMRLNDDKKKLPKSFKRHICIRY